MPDEKDQLINRIEQVEEWLLLLTIRDRSSGLFALNLTIQQLRVLMLLFAEGGTSAHKLADAVGVGLPTLTGIVDRLEGRGLAQRSLDPHDRRIRRIELTGEGRRLVGEFVELGRERKRSVLRRLDLRILRNLAEAVEATRDIVAADALAQPGPCDPARDPDPDPGPGPGPGPGADSRGPAARSFPR
jgi:DNA-binding MarR family transcriptional regulator